MNPSDVKSLNWKQSQNQNQKQHTEETEVGGLGEKKVQTTKAQKEGEN